MSSQYIVFAHYTYTGPKTTLFYFLKGTRRSVEDFSFKKKSNFLVVYNGVNGADRKMVFQFGAVEM